MKDSILTCDWNHHLTILILKHFFESISKFFFVHKVVNFVGLNTILNGLNKSIRDHEIGAFELTELERKTDWSLFVIKVKSIDYTKFIELKMPRCPTHGVSTWEGFQDHFCRTDFQPLSLLIRN